MYTKRNTIYAEAGRVLVLGPTVAFHMEGVDPSAVTERECPLRGVRVSGSTASWGGIIVALPVPLTYAALKRRLVQLRYSVDDQIAVMCNADPAELARMQAWRDWAASAAKAICARAGISSGTKVPAL